MQKSVASVSEHTYEFTYAFVALSLTYKGFFKIIEAMTKEIASVSALPNLERSVHEMLADYQRLRGENSELRQQLAVRTDEVARLNARLEKAASRIETLIEHLPE
jgi:uncharacterized protein (TIGR02449 family)